MTTLVPDPTELQALFDKAFFGKRLHALDPKGGGSRIWNTPAASKTWLPASVTWQRENDGDNFYFSPVIFTAWRPDLIKPSGKRNVLSTRWVWLDLDPVTKEITGEQFDKERAEMLRLLTTGLPDGVPAPTFVVDSGRGYWGLWLLKAVYAVDGPGGAATRALEARLRGLANAFGDYGDRSVINSNRIVRLPSTINQKTGRVATVVAFNRGGYTLEDFPVIAVKAAPQRADSNDWAIPTELLVRMLAATDYTGGPAGLDDRRSYAEWLKFAMAVHQACNGDADGLAAFTEWCLADPERDDDPEKIRAHWDSFEAVGGITRGSWIMLLNSDPKNAELVSEIMTAQDAAAEAKRIADFAKVLDEHILCTAPSSFIARDSTNLISEKTFRTRYNPFTAQMRSIPTRYKDDAAKYVISLPFGEIKRVDGLCYRPGDTERIVDGKANMWVAPSITPLDEEPTILLDHINYLIPNEVERELVLDWLAHCVQKPMVKLMFALLIVDAIGGTGKSFIGYLMRAILGRLNVLMMGKDDKVDARFNSKFLNKCFTFIHEAMPGGKTNLVEALKDKITEDTVSIEKKGVDEFDAENRNNIMAVTNFINALKIMLTNRRWLIAMGTTDVRFCDDLGAETPATVEYYRKLFVSIGKGTPLKGDVVDEDRRALNFFMKRDLSKFSGQGNAPRTKAKEDAADANAGTWSSFLNGAKANKTEPFTKKLFTLQEVLDVLARNFDNAKTANVRTPALRAAVIECGCRDLKKQSEANGERARLWTLTPGDAEKYDEMSPAAVMKLYMEMGTAGAVDEFSDGDDEPVVKVDPAAVAGDLDLEAMM